MQIKEVMKSIKVVTVLLRRIQPKFVIKYIARQFFSRKSIGFCDMRITNNILLKVLGILLLAAAVMKGWQLLTEPMANKDI